MSKIPQYIAFTFCFKQISFKGNLTLKNYLYLVVYLPFLMLFIPLCSYRFPSGLIVHFPSAWGLPFTFHIVQICWWWMISLSFLYACKSLYLSFIIDRFFLLGIEFQIDSFFLEYIKMLFYWLLACTISDKRFVVILIFYSIFCEFSGSSWDFSFSLVLSSLSMVVFFRFLVFGVCWAWVCRFVVFINYRKFSALFLQMVSLTCHPSLLRYQ